MNYPKISIVTPNYNYGSYIGRTIESVFAQNYDNIEHIIVDDGSSDDSVKIIENYEQLYLNKIKLIKQENRGQTSAINVGLRAATGDILGWINSDDFYVSDIFKDIVNIFNSEDEIDIVYGDFNIVDLEGNFLQTRRHLKFRYFEGVFAGFGNCLTSNCVFWREKLLTKLGYLNEEFVSNMDGEFFSRLFYKAKLKKIDKPIANFRQQVVSKAGVERSDWDLIVKKEREIEFRNSYKKLFIKKIVPYFIGKRLMLPVVAYRKIKKVIFF